MLDIFMRKNLSKDILKFLGMGGILIAAVIAPNAVGTFKFILKDENKISWKKFNKSRINETLKRLIRRGLIKTHLRNKKIEYMLTINGKQEILKFDFEELKLKSEKNWDGWWRIIIFDIPEHKKAARDALRRKFLKLGMHQLQKSVFIYPFNCKKEIDFISAFYGVFDETLYLKAKVADIGDKLKGIFDLK